MKIQSLELLSAKPFLNKSIAIVGNGGVTRQDDIEVGKCDHVIRFNNYSVRQGISHLSNPNRCDTLFTHFDLHPGNTRPKNVVIGIPYPFHVDRIIKLSDLWFPSSALYMVNPYMNYQLCQEININSEGHKHPLPSLGLTALWHLNRLKVNLKSRIYICGFNWYYDHEKELMQGYKLNHQPRPTHFNHDYWKESTWIVNHLVGKYNWIFSKSCMSVLNKVKGAMP